MSSLELNKIAGAGILAGLIALTTGILADRLVQPDTVQHAAVAVPEGTGEAVEAPAEQEQPIAVLLASADPAAGEGVARRCASCHTFEQGGANKIGPNLYGVVGADIAHLPDFPYSDALLSLEGNWDFESLSAFLASPRDFAPGTKMTFAGLKDAADRADLLVYLRSLSDSPVPLPEPPADTAAAPAEGTATDATATTGEAAEDASAESDATTTDATTTQEAALPADADIGALVAAADASNGEKIAKRCLACHTFEEGGANKIGPNLWDVVGGPTAHKEDYQYSDAIRELEGGWTYEALDQYLTAPREYAPGTKMTFAGIKKADDRADLLAWMRTQSDEPEPLP